MARREVKLIDRAIAHIRREAYTEAQTRSTRTLMRGLIDYERHTNVTDDESAVTLGMLANLADKRRSRRLRVRVARLQGRR